MCVGVLLCDSTPPLKRSGNALEYILLWQSELNHVYILPRHTVTCYIYIIKLKLLRFLSFASLQIYYKNLEWNMLMEYLANGLVIWGRDYLFLNPGFKSTIRLHGKLNFLPFLGKSNSWKWSVSLKLLCRLEGIKPYS